MRHSLEIDFSDREKAARDADFFNALLILTSQHPVSEWHDRIGEPTVADALLDRIVHSAHRIEIKGESLRKRRGMRNAQAVA